MYDKFYKIGRNYMIIVRNLNQYSKDKQYILGIGWFRQHFDDGKRVGIILDFWKWRIKICKAISRRIK